MKIFDMWRYYERVRYCCCFGDHISNEERNILQQAITFNHVLEAPYQILIQDNLEFIAFYREYRAWLLAKFISPYHSFSASYKNLFSIPERKAFSAIYGAVSREALFFAQTFCDFSEKALESKEEQLAVAHKMRLGSLEMLLTIGCSIYEWDVAYEKDIIDRLQHDQNT